jgi:DNA polymerase-1
MDWEWDEDTLEPVGLAVSNETGNWYLPIRSLNYGHSYGKDIQEEAYEVTQRVNTVWHNAKADINAQFKHINPLDISRPLDDTLVMAYLIGEPELDLKTLTKKFLKREPTSYPGNLSQMEIPIAARYATADTRNTWDLFTMFSNTLRMQGQVGVYESLERPLVPLIASMERDGSPLDIRELYALHKDFADMEEAIRSWAWQRWRVDLSSDKETKQLLTRLTGYEVTTLDQRVLSRNPAGYIDVVLGYRRLRTLRRNFLGKHIDRWRETGYPSDYRAYPSFNQAGTSDEFDTRSFKRAPRSGRLSSSRPNFQNQPRDIRSMFIPPDGMAMVVFDYSGLEMRTAAAISNDPVFMDVFLRGGDPHGEFQQAIKEQTGLGIERVVAKNGNFNLNYRGTADMLITVLAKDRVHIDYKVSNQIVDTHHTRHAVLHAAGDEVIKQARHDGYVTSIRGRRRYLPELSSPDPAERASGERIAVNHVLGQGSAADLMKDAMVKIIPVLLAYDAHCALQVHDELVFWVDLDRVEAFCHDIKAAMESVELPGLPLIAEGGYGKNWGEVK